MTDPSNDNGNVRRTEYFALSDLLKRFHLENPKEHHLELIINSLRSHGYVEPVNIDSRTGLIAAGHGRVQALAMMKRQGMPVPRYVKVEDGEWFVPTNVGYESDNDDKAKAYLVASNETTIAGDWNEPKLAELLQDIAASTDAVLEDTAMDAERLDELLRDLDYQQEPPPAPEAEISKADELQQKWQVKRGDVWIIPSKTGKGSHRIMCGDSTSEQDVNALMNNVKAGLILTDPPYGEINNEWDKQVVWWPILQTVYTNQTYLAFTSSMKYFITIVNEIQNNGWLLRWDAIWNKPGTFMISDKMPIRSHELVLVYSRDNAVINDLYFDGYAGGEDGEYWEHTNKNIGHNRSDATYHGLKNNGNRYGREDGRRWITTSWYETKGNIRFLSGGNATAKPVRLFQKLILALCPHNGNIYDPFLGSGTTICACEQTGRVGYGMELEPKYVSVSLERLSQMGLTPERGDGM